MAKVKLDLATLTIPEKVALARKILTEMTGNADFATPSPPLADLTAKAAVLETRFNTAQQSRNTAQADTGAQNGAEHDLDAAVTAEGGYVEHESGGDEGKIRSTGMDVRADAAPVGALPAPVNLSATTGDHDGEIDLHWDKVKGAKSYTVQQCADPITPTGWAHAAVVTPTKATIEHLTSGTKYWFRVAAVGAAGQSAWSDPSTKFAP